MEQHPIPQQISSYQFKLVGDMTLKQFFQVAGGALVGLLFYSTGLHPIIKWPIILLSVGLGAGMAFLPFEERPLEKWIVAFFRSIYSPTLFSWKKTEKPEVFFTEEAKVPEITNLGTINQKANISPLEAAEQTFLSKIGSLWASPTHTPQPITPNLTQTLPTDNNPKTTPQQQPVAIPQQVPTSIGQATLITKSAPRLIVEESMPKKGPQTQASSISPQEIKSKPITSKEAEFSIDAAPPYPPTVVNTIVGQIMDANRKIIEGAIMEIKDSNGRPVRALKSNKAGHFIIVTPLANGKYEIMVEKEGYSFEPVSFEAKGELIDPIAIKAK